MPPQVAPVSAVVTEDGLRHRSKARGLLNASNLPALQNLIKRDPGAYVEDFRAQWNHYESLRRIYASMAGVELADGGAASSAAQSGISASSYAVRSLSKEDEDKFVALLAFVTQLAPSYPDITASLFSQLSSLLLEHHSAISKDVRAACVRSLVLMRNRSVISSEQLLKTLFPLLLASPSAALRTLLQRTITTDLKNANAKSKNHSLNRVVQSLLFGVVEAGMPSQHGGSNAADYARAGYGKRESGSKSGGEALWAVRLAAELWGKHIWNDEKTVSLLALACLHPHPRVQSSAIRFFLGDLHSAEAGDSDAGSDSEDEPEIPNMDALKHHRKINKKTKSVERKIRVAASLARKRRKAVEDKRMEKEGQEGDSNVAALYLLHDPQGFGEKLFEELKRGDKRLMLEQKVRIMQLLARVMSSHKTAVLPFYSYVIKYLMPHQVHITLILVSVAQSVHPQTPPSVLMPLIRKLAHNFVHPGVGPEVVAAGINTIREICARQVWALGSEDADYDDDGEVQVSVEGESTAERKALAKRRADDGRDLLEDLISYRRSKDKGVSAASRGLLALYRRENPKLLPRKERGKEGALKAGAEDFAVRGFGENNDVTHGITGLDLLQKHLDQANSEDEEGRDREAWEGWDQDSDEDSDASSGGWINVSSEGEDINVSDSDDENGEKRAQKKLKTNADENAKTPAERVRERRHAKRATRQRARAGLAEPSTEKPAIDDEQPSIIEAATEDGNSGGVAADPAMDAATAQAAADAISELATTRILTPADFAMLHKLRLEAAQKAMESTKAGSRAQQALKREIAQLEARRQRTQATEADAPSGTGVVNEVDILGLRKRKMDYEERMAHIEKGREGRDPFGSKKGKKSKAKPSSSNNAEKKKSKPFMMVNKSFSVRDKKNAKLSTKVRRLKAAKDKQKKQYK